MRGNPKCFGKVKKFYPDTLSLKRTDKGILIGVDYNASPCSGCRKKVACFTIALREEVNRSFGKVGRQAKEAKKLRKQEIVSLRESCEQS